MQSECPSCHRNGCDDCAGTGWFDLDKCPIKYCGEESMDVLDAARFLKRGILPEPGNLSEQPWRLMEIINYASSLIRSEDINNLGALAPLLAMGI